MFFDELDRFVSAFRTRNIGHSEAKQTEEDDIIDELLDLYLLAYFEGSKQAAEELGFNVDPSVSEAKETIESPIAGKTYRDRVREYLNGEMGETTGTPAEAIARVADTDSVRIFNEAGMATAKKAGATKKTWHTMEDNKVRDTHILLDEVSAPLDGFFYTYTGEKALAPGQFGSAAEDVNCRCYLTFSK